MSVEMWKVKIVIDLKVTAIQEKQEPTKGKCSSKWLQNKLTNRLPNGCHKT